MRGITNLGAVAIPLIFLTIIACERRTAPFIPSLHDGGAVVLKFAKGSVPKEVSTIIATMTRPGYESRYAEAPVSADSVILTIQDLAAGVWHLRVDAKDDQGVIIYSGETDVNILPGQISKVYLELQPVGGVEIHVTWGTGGPQTFVYDFDSGHLMGWGGPASAEILDGILHLWDTYGFKYHTISPTTDEHFTSGTIEFDIKPGSGDYSFETKGATAFSYILNWGVYIRWRDGHIRVVQSVDGQRTLVDTGVPYETNTWQHVRIVFDNNAGPKGRFSLWVRDEGPEAQEVFVGEFSHLAEYGRLVGVNQISLGVYDPERQTPRHVYYDNIRFTVWQ